jgi:hypothetical protein
MTYLTDIVAKHEKRLRQLREAQQRRRDKLKIAGLRAASGPSGGKATQGMRAKRYRERKKLVDARD